MCVISSNTPFITINSHTTGNQIGAKGAESIARALQSNTSLQALDIRCALFHQTHHSSPSNHTQQATKLDTMVLRALQELFNQTRLFTHWTSDVRDFIKHTIHHHKLMVISQKFRTTFALKSWIYLQRIKLPIPQRNQWIQKWQQLEELQERKRTVIRPPK